MKRKVFIVFMIIFTIYIAGILLVSLICGAPMGSRAELNRYLFGAVGMSILLPGGFSFFFISALDLSKKLDGMEDMEKADEDGVVYDISNISMLIQQFVNAFSKKKNLTKEKKEDLISYLEDYK
ncbi:MAG: hypothetical protein Q4C91_17545 [Eubacteriales bacterium]|nr:hypothetical protein [Eubacteriales bacterium]